MPSDLGRLLFIALVFMVSLGAYTWSRQMIRSGRRVMSAVFMYTEVVFLLLVWWIMQGSDPNFFALSLSHMSWAAICDPTLFPILAVILATAYSKAQDPVQYMSMRAQRAWYWVPWLSGLAIGCGFHLGGGRSDSQSLILNERLHDSPMPWAHDLGAFSMYFGVFVSTIIPMLLKLNAKINNHLSQLAKMRQKQGKRLALIALLLGAVVWGGASAADNIRMRLDPTHPEYFNPHWTDSDQVQWGF